MKAVGIIPGYRPSLIDHLVPLCSLMDAPVMTTSQSIADLIALYYPDIEVILAQPDDGILDKDLKGYDLFIYTHFYRQGNGCFFFDEYYTRLKPRSLMSLHGNPDKFLDIFWLEKLIDEDILLAYGPQLVELIEQKKIPKKPIVCGNYRFEYFKAHEAFFDERLPFSKEKTTLLYAPTWGSVNRKIELRKYYTSFFDNYRELFETLPSDFQLIVKLHPFLSSLMYDEIQQIKADYSHIQFLGDCPLIYPLLKQVDYYIGDYSSIGYDFLAFDRPLFFLGPLKKTPLHDCGLTIQNQPIYETIREAPDSFGEKRKALYKQVYGERKTLSELKQCVLTSC
ncbi:MAG: CDP-glycerol glycerophosphotransferase family protein [Chlamydiales bacterium]|nr:CDP-glycerol glycerophosphotransferase family protein [Chlamydiales bacterium]